jgi:purine catabolism regulator
VNVHTPAPTLRALLGRTELRLALAVRDEDLPTGALDAPIRWVHSSDLADPTPFLSEGLVLLTTGTQFTAAGEDPEPYDAYVARLVVRGVVALGFGTEVVRAGIPAPLARACADARLPLFEVPYRTPFIAVARANAEAIAAQDYARRSWSLAAQRSIALAALRPDGLGESIAELSRQLGAWVGLFDGGGGLAVEHPPGALGTGVPAAVADEARRVLRRGARAASTLRADDAPYTLQTLGRGGHLRGVIAVAGDLDAEARVVVTSVVAMVGLALEQGRDIARARAQLRGALVQLLRAGRVGEARRVARELWGGLPAAPVHIAWTDAAASRRESLVTGLDAIAEQHRGAVIHGRTEDGIVLIVGAGAGADADADAGAGAGAGSGAGAGAGSGAGAGAGSGAGAGAGSGDPLPAVAALAREHDLRIGVSDALPYEQLAAGLEQARIAQERGAGSGLARFGDAARDGILALVDAEAARAVARSRLAPLLERDATTGSALIVTVRTWLEHDGSNDRTARELGIHRHTVRAHVALAARLLDRDLSGFAARADLWTDLRALR